MDVPMVLSNEGGREGVRAILSAIWTFGKGKSASDSASRTNRSAMDCMLLELRSPCKGLFAVRIRWGSQDARENLTSVGKLVGRHCGGLSDDRDSSEEREA